MIRFKLQSVLKLREQVEEVEKRRLGELRIEEKQLKSQYQEVLEQWGQMKKTLELLLLGRIHPQEIQHMNDYLHQQQKKVQNLEKDLLQKQEQITQQQKKLEEAMKDRKVLENLKEIKIEEFLQEEKQREQLMTDELVSYKYSATERSDADGKY